jgi:hypothetical protein
MKKTILIFYGLLLCSFSWAQGTDQSDSTKPKTQNVPVNVRVADNDAKQVIVYPNPSNGIVHVTLAGFQGKRTELRVLNVIGNVVYREVLTEADNRFTRIIDLTKNASGIYYLKLEAADFSEIRKIIIN